MNTNRQPAGTPAGGQFAAGSTTESVASLMPQGHRRRPWTPQTDSLAIDRLAIMLADTDGSESTGDYLEDAANFIAATGRPHPGDTDSETYMAELVAWADEGPDRGRAGKPSKDTNSLNTLALHLAATPDWSADEVEELSKAVTRTGRPVVNDELRDADGETYQRALKKWYQERSTSADSPAQQ